MEVFVNVIGQKLRIPSNFKKVIAGSKNFVKLVFTLSSDWAYMTPHAKFVQDWNVFDASLGSDHTCYLPSGIVPGKFTLTLYGVGLDGEIIAVTNDILLFAEESSFDADTDGESTEDEYDGGYVATLQEILDYIETGSSSDSHNDTSEYSIASIEDLRNYLNI